MIVLSVLLGTIAKQHHFLDLPDGFLEWVLPFLLMAGWLQGARHRGGTDRKPSSEGKEQLRANEKEAGMRSLFPSSYDRADVLMSAGCSTFVSAALILVIPRFGILLLEILLGLFFIGCALVARKRLRRQALGKDSSDEVKRTQRRDGSTDMTFS